MNTLEIILVLDWVLDHSDVMTALKGYSAPMPMEKRCGQLLQPGFDVEAVAYRLP